MAPKRLNKSDKIILEEIQAMEGAGFDMLEIYKNLGNAYRSRFCDGKARPLEKGEISFLPGFPCHNWTGPNTRLDLPEVASQEPYDGVDACSKEHDYLYNDANKLPAGQKEHAIRAADQRYLLCVDASGEPLWKRKLAQAGIGSKILAEKSIPKSLLSKFLPHHIIGGLQHVNDKRATGSRRDHSRRREKPVPVPKQRHKTRSNSASSGKRRRQVRWA